MNRIKAATIAAVLIATPLVMNSYNDYSTYRDYDVKVVDVLSGTSSGKYSRLEFIGIFETKDGVRFDRYLSPTAYTQIKAGDNITLELRPFDVKQTLKENIIWVFGGIAANVLGFGIGAVFGAAAFSRRFNKWAL